MYSFIKLIRSNERYTLIESIMVCGILSILGIVALTRFLEVIQKVEKVIVANAISSIKIECESNNYLRGDLIFTPSNLIGYTFDNQGSNKCTGNEKFSLVSIIPKDLKNSPHSSMTSRVAKYLVSMKGLQLRHSQTVKKLNNLI